MENPKERGKLLVGDSVIYHDPTGKPFNALVTASWDGNLTGTINLLYVSGDDNKQDSYGRWSVNLPCVTLQKQPFTDATGVLRMSQCANM
jgi:hypothetical protein